MGTRTTATTAPTTTAEARKLTAKVRQTELGERESAGVEYISLRRTRTKGLSDAIVLSMQCTSMAIKSIISRALGLRNVSHDFYIARSLTRPEWLYQFGTTIPKAPIAMTPVNEPSEEDVTLCHRLIAAYTKAASGDLMTDGPIWSSMIRREYGSLRATVDSRDASALAELLCRMFRSSCVHGIASGDLYRANLAKRFWQLKLLDDCVSLAEYLGAVRVENPEQGRIGVAPA